MDGFTFAGTHCSRFGVRYHPDAKARGNEMEDYEVNDLTPDNRDGGYYIGARVKPRVFELDCFFEDISALDLEGIYRWLRRDRRGRLIFDNKPYVFYEAVPCKKISINLYVHASANGMRRYSGTFAAMFTCHEPFGKLLRSSYLSECGEAELTGTGILPSHIMPLPPGTGSTHCLLYNPGTERAPTIIRLTGDVGDGLLLRNLTTGQRCKITGLTHSSMLPGARLELDSAMGQTRIVLGEQIELAFPYHDEGYIELAPCTPFVRSVEIAHTAGSNMVYSPHLEKEMTGQYIFLNGWKKLSLASDGSAIVSQMVGSTGITYTPVVTMNEIQIEGAGSVQTRFEIDYFPRVR